MFLQWEKSLRRRREKAEDVKADTEGSKERRLHGFEIEDQALFYVKSHDCESVFFDVETCPTGPFRKLPPTPGEKILRDRARWRWSTIERETRNRLSTRSGQTL